MEGGLAAACQGVDKLSIVVRCNKQNSVPTISKHDIIHEYHTNIHSWGIVPAAVEVMLSWVYRAIHREMVAVEQTTDTGSESYTGVLFKATTLAQHS